MYYLGYDIGSSSIKVALVDGETNFTVGVAHYPDKEMEIMAPKPGWAEQDPDTWWENAKQATAKLLANVDDSTRKAIAGIGVSYQMHGLVLVDSENKVLRPSIIWCDSRAVGPGEQGFKKLGEEKCLTHLLNSPGNFTASKLKWVRDNEPEIYRQIDKIMLPGDYIGLKMTGEVLTTPSGLSEGIMWDFLDNAPASFMFEEFGITENIIPEIRSTFSEQGTVTEQAAAELGVPVGIPVGYRAGDQPNNAMSLGVLHPGQIAATGGTSGVVYGVVDKPNFDNQSRVNSFVHVNHTRETPRIGVLLCINGTGIQYRWIREQMAEENIGYGDMEKILSEVPVNSEGLRIIPFGNGAERIINNKDIGAQFSNIQFNRHGKKHFYRASLEGIAFSFAYGMEILKSMGIKAETMKVGNDNLFQSEVFSNTLATLLQCDIEVVETTGAVGAAKAVGYTLKHKVSLDQAMEGNKKIKTIEPTMNSSELQEGFMLWKDDLNQLIKQK